MAKRWREHMQEELEALWRPYPEFIGPAVPPMWLWLWDREAQRRWELEVNLRPPEPRYEHRPET